MMFLLDVNVLLAMKYMRHVHYCRVETWLRDLAVEHRQHRVFFTTCPITELGFLRVSSGKAAYAATLKDARNDLATLKAVESMQLIPADLPPCAGSSGRLCVGGGAAQLARRLRTLRAPGARAVRGGLPREDRRRRRCLRR